MAVVPNYSAELLYLSAAGPQAAIKAMRALLYLPKIQFEVWLAGSGDYSADADVHSGQHFHRGKDGYDVWCHALGYGTYHLVAKSRRPGFMPNLSAESVWQEIASPRFTTPVVREWAEYVMERLIEAGYIQQANCFGCECGYMTADDKQLDKVVQKGLKDKDIFIR